MQYVQGADALFIAFVRQATGLDDTTTNDILKKICEVQVRVQRAITEASDTLTEDANARNKIIRAVTIPA